MPTGTSRRRRAEPQSRAPAPVADPPIPDDSYLAGRHTLDSAVEAHNNAHPDMAVSVHYARSALLLRLSERGYLWCLIRTQGVSEDTDASELRVLGVRCFLGRDTRVSPSTSSQSRARFS